MAFMPEPRLPEPMTPERATAYARRWRWAAYVFIAAAGFLLLLGAAGLALALPVLAALWCIESRAECRGWVDGYRAGRTEVLRCDADRQGSGEPR